MADRTDNSDTSKDTIRDDDRVIRIARGILNSPISHFGYEIKQHRDENMSSWLHYFLTFKHSGHSDASLVTLRIIILSVLIPKPPVQS